MSSHICARRKARRCLLQSHMQGCYPWHNEGAKVCKLSFLFTTMLYKKKKKTIFSTYPIFTLPILMCVWLYLLKLSFKNFNENIFYPYGLILGIVNFDVGKDEDFGEVPPKE